MQDNIMNDNKLAYDTFVMIRKSFISPMMFIYVIIDHVYCKKAIICFEHTNKTVLNK